MHHVKCNVIWARGLLLLLYNSLLNKYHLIANENGFKSFEGVKVWLVSINPSVPAGRCSNYTIWLQRASLHFSLDNCSNVVMYFDWIRFALFWKQHNTHTHIHAYIHVGFPWGLYIHNDFYTLQTVYSIPNPTAKHHGKLCIFKFS